MDYTSFYKELDTKLKHNCYLLNGNEDWIQNAILEKALSTLLKDSISLNFSSFYDLQDFNDILVTISTLPIFSNYRVVSSTVTGSSISSDLEKKLKLVITQNPSSIVFLLGNLEPKHNIYKLASNIGSVVECGKLPRNLLPKWCKQRFDFYKVTASDEVINLFAKNSNYEKEEIGLKNLDLEIAKYAKGVLEKSDIKISCGETDTKWYEFIEQLFRGDRKAFVSFKNIEYNTPPLLLFYKLHQQILQLATLHLFLLEGGKNHEISSSIGIPYFSITDNIKILNLISPKDLFCLVDLCDKCDNSIKTSSVDENQVIKILIQEIFSKVTNSSSKYLDKKSQI